MELFRALAVFAEPPTADAARVAEVLGLGALPAADEYTETFVFQLYPYASVYLGAEGMMGGEARDLVAGFWRALGQTPPAEADHLSVMLALYARLCELEGGAGDERGRAGWRGARRAFLWEHLLSWLPVYLSKLEEIATPFYHAWGRVLSAALAGEAEAAGRPRSLSLHLRESRSVVDPRNASAEEFLQSLLAPARSGLILARADLARAARELEISTRAGERVSVLKSLVGQTPRAALGWLAAEAGAWAVRHRGLREQFGETAQTWEGRARATERLLRELESAAVEDNP